MKVQVFDVPGMDLGFISGGFWRPVAHFSLFSEVPERCWNLDGFSMSAVGPERSRHGGHRGGSRGGVLRIIRPPTSPLGLSPKIEEEEEKRRS